MDTVHRRAPQHGRLGCIGLFPRRGRHGAISCLSGCYSELRTRLERRCALINSIFCWPYSRARLGRGPGGLFRDHQQSRNDVGNGQDDLCHGYDIGCRDDEPGNDHAHRDGSNSSTSDGPSVGTIVGIVAGVLVGVIVLATICGWLFRKKFGRKDEDEDSPFDRDDFRRQSMLIDDDQGGYAGGHSPQMSEHSMNPAYGNLGRQNTVLPGLARNGTMQDPRPPSSIVNHFQRPQQQQQMAPSFSPGQIVPNAYGQPSPPRPVFNAAPGGSYGGGNPGMDLYGGYPLAAGQHQQLDRGIYGMPAQHLQHPNYAQQNQQQGLERNPSNASGYSQGPPANDRRSPAPSHSPHDDRPLSLVHEEDGETYSRSGTPVDSNVQQSYFAHGHSDSTSSARGGPLAPNHRLSVGTNLPGYEPFGKGGFGSSSLSPEVIENPFARQRSLTGETWQDAKDNRAQRTLSVRNGNEQHMHNGRPVSTAESDAYGGYS
ncbi:hypothetical protein RQP46_007710 [Phenoliferia psychrophenolica]